MSFYEIRIKDISDIFGLNFPEYWIFRGQEKDWVLKSSIERLFDELNYDYYWLNDSEWNIEEVFTEKFKQKTECGINSRIECRALMQHYGMPTRLLDFTKSLLVALYFVTENYDKSDCDGIVWALNLAQLYKCHVEGGRVINVNKGDSEEVRTEYTSRTITNIGRLFPMVIPVDLHDEHLEKNARFKNQKGKFLMPLKGCGFEKSLYDSFNLCRSNKQEMSFQNFERNFLETKLIKFIIFQKNKKALSSSLNKIGINKEFLFSDDNDCWAPKFREICIELKEEFIKKELEGRNILCRK